MSFALSLIRTVLVLSVEVYVLVNGPDFVYLLLFVFHHDKNVNVLHIMLMIKATGFNLICFYGAATTDDVDRQINSRMLNTTAD